MPDVAEDVIAVIAKRIPGKAGTIKLSDSLPELGLELIDAIELIFDLEEKFGVQIPYNANSSTKEFATVGDVVTAINRLLAEKK